MSTIRSVARNMNMKGPTDGRACVYFDADALVHTRTVLFAALCNGNPHLSWKTKTYADGSMPEGVFLAGMTLPGTGEVSYHIDSEHWGLFKVEEKPSAPHFSGYTPDDVLDRLTAYFCED